MEEFMFGRTYPARVLLLSLLPPDAPMLNLVTALVPSDTACW
jgi:hypothetical protein